MASIKLKFRPSSTEGSNGSLFFQITHRRQRRLLRTGLLIGSDEWDAARDMIIGFPEASATCPAPLKSTMKRLDEIHSRLLTIISRLDLGGIAYTVRDVVNAYNSQPSMDGFTTYIRGLVVDMRNIGKTASAKRYNATLNCLLRYTEGDEVGWTEISSTFILGFEEFMIRRGLCRNSTSFYMRNLRAILNHAVGQGYEIQPNLFKHVYMGVDKTVKRAIPIDVVREIRDIDLSKRPALDFARKVFMFAFYTRGMSFVDIAFLKKSDLRNGVITYSRRKTRRQLMVRVEPETWKLIESFGNNDTPFLLPIITGAERDYERQYENAYYRINRNIQKIGDMLGLKAKLTLYVARHAWASIAHANDVALSTISRAMGHDSEKTTAIYLQSIDSASVDKANSDIIRMIDTL